jgi:hypothetical protein
MPELGRQVAPWAARSHNPEDPADCPSPITGLARQELLDAFALVVTQHFSVHPDSAQKSGYDHISFTVNSPRYPIDRERLLSPCLRMAYQDSIN